MHNQLFQPEDPSPAPRPSSARSHGPHAMPERGGPRRALLIAAIIAAVLIAGAIVSTIWSSTSGPTGEPAWIENIENSRWFELLDNI